MQLLKALVSMFLANLAIIFKDLALARGHIDYYFNIHEIGYEWQNELSSTELSSNELSSNELSEPESQSKLSQIATSIVEGPYPDASAEDAVAYLDGGATLDQVDFYHDAPFYEPTNLVYPNQIDAVAPNVDSHQFFENNTFNCFIDSASGSPNCSILSSTPNPMGQSCSDQPLEGNDEQHLCTHHNPANPPSVLPALTRISQLNLNLEQKIWGKKFQAPENWRLHRIPLPETFHIFKGVAYAPFIIKSKPSIWGRTGWLELYARVVGPSIFLFETKTGFMPPTNFRNKGVLGLDEIRHVFRNANWGIRIGGPSQIVKVGGDPSKVISLWVITNDKVDMIDLTEQEISRELSLQKGNLIVAIPAQLNGLMKMVGAGTSYNDFLAFVEKFVDLGLDQLILVIEVLGETAAQTTLGGVPHGSINPMNPPHLTATDLETLNRQPLTGTSTSKIEDCLNKNDQPIALKTPNRPSALTKISELDSDLKSQIKNLGFLISDESKLSCQSISEGDFKFSNGIIYATFLNVSDMVWGRVAAPELYVRVTEYGISLFEIRHDTNPAEERKDVDIFNQHSFEATLKSARWSVQLGASGWLMKTGADPLETMALWVITSKWVKRIDLADAEISRNLFLNKGDLVIAVSTQLNPKMRQMKKGTTYHEFLAGIKGLADSEADQLVLVVEI